MKRLFHLPLLVLWFCAVACSCAQQSPDNNPDIENPDVSSVYKFVASPLQGKWNVGDQIYVRGNLGYDAQVITLTAAEISDDGKTASVQLDEKLIKSPAEPDGLYAAWPADAINLYNGIAKTKNTFKDCETLLTAAYLSGDSFQFLDVSGAMVFAVDGDYDKWAICANDRDGICITRFEVDYSSLSKAFKYKQNDGYPYRYGNLESGKAEIWFPGDFRFSNGFTIYLGKGDNWTSTYTANGAQSLMSGQIKDIGNITASLLPYNGPAPKMPRQGEVTKFTVKFNELSGLCVSADGSFLWSVGDGGELAKFDFQGKLVDRVDLHWGDPAAKASGKKEGDGWGTYDTEGITVDLRNGDLICSEEANYVGRISKDDLATAFEDDEAWNILPTIFTIPDAKNYGNAGMEGITYYKDGMVFVGAQSNSHLFLCDIDTQTILWKAKLWDKNRLSEIAGMCYDPKSGWLWIIDSEAKKVFVFAVDHSVTEGKWSVNMDYIGAYPIAGDNPESVCIDRVNNCMWVGDDYGSTSYLYRYEFTGFDEFDIVGYE